MNALSSLASPLWQAVGLLVLSNVFMTFAWYAHLKELGAKPTPPSKPRMADEP